MKKILALILVLVLVFGLVGCGSKSKVSPANTVIAQNVITAVDKYLDKAMSDSELTTILDKALDDLDDGGNNMMKLNAVLLGANIALVRLNVTLGGDDSREKIVEARNDIAELVGAKARK